MKERITGYRKSIDKYLEDKIFDDIDDIYKNHLIQISFFQHERLVHLIVTVLFAIMEVILVCINSMIDNLGLMILQALVCVLLLPYILHYYTLENETQKMYRQYDELRKYINKSNNWSK